MPQIRPPRMSAQQALQLLDESRTIVLATIGAAGLPHLAAMWFARDDDTIVMWTYRASQKARNIQRDPRVSVLVEAGDSYNELRGTCLEAWADLVTDQAKVLDIGRSLGRRYSKEVDDNDNDVRVEARAEKRVGIRLSITRVRAWDHRTTT